MMVAFMPGSRGWEGDTGWAALIRNPRSQVLKRLWRFLSTRILPHQENVSRTKLLKHYIKYPQSMGLQYIDFVVRLGTHLPDISLCDICKYHNIWKKKKTLQIQNTSGPEAFQIRDSQLPLNTPLPTGVWVFFIHLFCSAGDWTWVLAQDGHTKSYIPSLLIYLPCLTKLPRLCLNSLCGSKRPWDYHPPASASRVAEITGQCHEAQLWGTCFSSVLSQREISCRIFWSEL